MEKEQAAANMNEQSFRLHGHQLEVEMSWHPTVRFDNATADSLEMVVAVTQRCPK